MPYEFLPGVPEVHVISALKRARPPGFSGRRFIDPCGNLALVANTFGWFLKRPAQFPCLPGLDVDWPVREVSLLPDVGENVHCDALVHTDQHLIGVDVFRIAAKGDSVTDHAMHERLNGLAKALSDAAAAQSRKAVLYHLSAAPPCLAGQQSAAADQVVRHLTAVAAFAPAVEAAGARFAVGSYRDWLQTFARGTAVHAASIIHRFAP